MNSAFVKLLGNLGLLKLSSEEGKKVKIDSKDKMCVLVKAGSVITLKDKEEVRPDEDGSLIVQANQSVIIRPNVNMSPRRYHTFVSWNKALTESGALISPLTPIVRPEEVDSFGLFMRASKKIDLAEFDHIFELYQID